MQSLRTLALCCLLACLATHVFATMSAGNIESDSYIIAGPCTQASQAKTNAPLCTTFCRSGDCSKPTNLYSYALPGQGVTTGVQPSQVVTSLYQISVGDPTIVGVTGNNTMLIFSCRDSNCADYNQATYLKLDGNLVFGRSVATTLTKESSLAILYTKSKTGGEAGFDLILDICKDPACNIKGTSVHIDTLIADSDIWLGFNVNNNAPMILVSDSHAQTLVSYTCTASSVCTKSAKPLVAEAFNAFSVSPVQAAATKKPKKPLMTLGFVVAYATYSPQAKESTIVALDCASDLSTCAAPKIMNVISNTTLPVMALSIFAEKDNAYQLAYATLDAATQTGALYMTHCGIGYLCGAPSQGNFSLGFAPNANTFEFDVQLLYSGDSGYSALTQASNDWQATDSPAASALFGLGTSGSLFAVSAPKYQVSKYHKAPPKIIVAIFVLAGAAILSTILLIIWRVWAGAPTTPGYTRIN